MKKGEEKEKKKEMEEGNDEGKATRREIRMEEGKE